MMEGKKKKAYTLRMDPEFYKALKLLSVELDEPIIKILHEAINDYMKKHGKSLVIEKTDNRTLRMF